MSCAAEFTAENVAVRWFPAMVARVPATRLAGALVHAKTCIPTPNSRANLADLAALFNKAVWAKRIAALPALAAWNDVRSVVFKPIMAANANPLTLPGSKARFSFVQRAHNDVVSGPWSMDMIRAAHRQRRFSKKVAEVVDHGLSAVFHWHTEALMQYP
ncbi:hypothetical protein AMAG_11420 [Allomyces macrogynus ATCC 38327]|uniref:Uncharacterized protein n=1 Tax=Allomyces macrogynus (strain ATCC 38327) TaxID=578462 RepID=A0A0L0SX12_ALLM3|nr:hypothetical protein AMAG_11420 [Allomyces macrogynus ATCC 38327]|eukprot:KNE66945.1 hypothetical protein AMAG_11420 [Allomyces macrogynus ATCC 38327]